MYERRSIKMTCSADLVAWVTEVEREASVRRFQTLGLAVFNRLYIQVNCVHRFQDLVWDGLEFAHLLGICRKVEEQTLA